MQLAFALCVYSFLSRALCFEEGVDKAKQHNKRIISRREKDQNWFNNLIAQAKEESGKNLRAAQDVNLNFPNIRKMSQGVNVLLGQPPFESGPLRNRILNFDYEGNIDNIEYLEFERKDGCDGYSSEEDMSYSYSSESFHQQTGTQTFGFGASFDFGVPVATTEASLSLAYSKSKVTGSLEKSALESTSYSFYSYGEVTLFRGILNWNQVTEEAYDSHFLEECVGLGENPSDEAVVNFFDQFGTHGFGEVTFGKRCTSLMVMEGEATKEEMEEWTTTTKEIESTFLWFQTSKSSQEEDKTKEVEEYNFTYKSSDNRCIGKVKHNNDCKNLEPVDDEELPEILHWEYKPIWEMDITGLSFGAKNKMKEFVASVLEEIISCGTKNCDSNGACPVNGRVEANVKDMINPNICICDEPYEGISCMENGERVNVAALEGTTATGAYDAQNAIDNKKDTHTRDTKYLEVELRELTKIERIVIWTSNSISSNGSLDLKIVGESGSEVKSVTSESISIASNKFDTRFQYNDIVLGKKVSIRTDSPLSIAEVQVYGKKPDLRKLDLKNEGKFQQTTTEGKAYARYAGDGKPDQASCTQLQEGKNKAKWRVDFNNVQKIQRIILLGANKYPLNNIVLEILDNNDQVVGEKEITEATTDEKSNGVLKYKFAFDGVDGHAVRIKNKNKGRLALAEVEVYVL